MAVNGGEAVSVPVEAVDQAGDAGSPVVEGERALFVGGPFHGTEREARSSRVVVMGDDLVEQAKVEVVYTRHTVVHPVGDRRFARRVWVDTRLTQGGQPGQGAFERMVDAVVCWWASGGVDVTQPEAGAGGVVRDG
jgi:hypothetical protein